MIFLPLPPSINNAFVNKPRGGRFMSAEYKAWRIESGYAIKQSMRVHGWVEIWIQVPAKMRGDIDNRIKPILDLMVEHGCIDDDKWVWRIVIERSHSIEKNKCGVSWWGANHEAKGK